MANLEQNKNHKVDTSQESDIDSARESFGSSLDDIRVDAKASGEFQLEDSRRRHDDVQAAMGTADWYTSQVISDPSYQKALDSWGLGDLDLEAPSGSLDSSASETPEVDDEATFTETERKAVMRSMGLDDLVLEDDLPTLGDSEIASKPAPTPAKATVHMSEKEQKQEIISQAKKQGNELPKLHDSRELINTIIKQEHFPSEIAETVAKRVSSLEKNFKSELTRIKSVQDITLRTQRALALETLHERTLGEFMPETPKKEGLSPAELTKRQHLKAAKKEVQSSLDSNNIQDVMDSYDGKIEVKILTITNREAPLSNDALRMAWSTELMNEYRRDLATLADNVKLVDRRLAAQDRISEPLVALLETAETDSEFRTSATAMLNAIKERRNKELGAILGTDNHQLYQSYAAEKFDTYRSVTAPLRMVSSEGIPEIEATKQKELKRTVTSIVNAKAKTPRSLRNQWLEEGAQQSQQKISTFCENAKAVVVQHAVSPRPENSPEANMIGETARKTLSQHASRLFKNLTQSS